MDNSRAFKSINDSPRPTKKRDTFSTDFLDSTPCFGKNLFNPFKMKTLSTIKNSNLKDQDVEFLEQGFTFRESDTKNPEPFSIPFD